MELFKQFEYFVEKEGLDSERIYHEKNDDYEVISFFEEIGSNEILNISFIIYNDQDSIEIYTRKRIEANESIDLYRAINNLNIEYRGMSFFYENQCVVLKSSCVTNGNFDNALKQMLRDVQIASIEFKSFI